YASEIRLMGLSSPYICAIPYLFMSLVNLIANILMPNYSHVVILPPQQHVISRTSSLTTLASKERRTRSAGNSDLEEGSKTTDIEAGSKTNFIRRKTWSFGKRYATEEHEWDEQYMSLDAIMRRGHSPEKDGKT